MIAPFARHMLTANRSTASAPNKYAPESAVKIAMLWKITLEQPRIMEDKFIKFKIQITMDHKSSAATRDM